LIGVAHIGRFEFQLLLDTGKPGSDQRREGEIRI